VKQAIAKRASALEIRRQWLQRVDALVRAYTNRATHTTIAGGE
jgi:hypothetical protein